MSSPAGEKITFLELARRVIDLEKKPMSAGEIWESAQKTELTGLLDSIGKTPEASLGARLYTDVLKPSSLFKKLGSRPAKFLLKSLTGTISDPKAAPVASHPPAATKQQKFAERDLHPLLVWYAHENFGVHCRTILHEQSTKLGTRQNQWIHPDVVGFALTTQGWTHQVVQLAQTTGAVVTRLYSFELKIAVDFTTLREYFFQAVSNSSWAHEGYLVAVDFDQDPDFRDELTRLSQSFGIGVIQLNINQPVDSEILLPARERPEIDWQTVNRVAEVNPGFKNFIGAVANSVKINHPSLDGFDKVLSDADLADYLKRTLGT